MKTSLRTLALCGAVGFGGYVLGSSAMNAKTPDQLPAVVAQGLPGLAALLGGGVKQDLLDLEVFPSGDTDAASPAGTEQPLDVTYLANEGFLLRAGDHAVVIDAFLDRPAYGYAAVPTNVMRAMVAGAAPFDAVKLVLVSHVHADHFQTGPAARFLRARPDVALVSSADVAKALRESGYDDAEELAARVRVVDPKPESFETIEAGGVRVDVFRLSHAGRDYDELANLGHVIHLGGKSILHVGDAHQADPRFPKFELPKRGVDVALLPVWMYTDIAPLVTTIGAKHWIACHIQPDRVATYTKMFEDADPEVIVFEAASQSRRFD